MIKKIYIQIFTILMPGLPSDPNASQGEVQNLGTWELPPVEFWNDHIVHVLYHVCFQT